MINFAVGPVQTFPKILEVAGQQVPYFRTDDFSRIMLENEKWMKELLRAPADSRVVFLTGSGTAAMESAVMNTLSSTDKAIVVNGGSFGQRFVDLCELHQIPFDQIRLEMGRALKAEMLEPFDGKGYTAFLVNVGETSSGVLYDMDLISRFCKKNHLFLICDCISSFLADPFHMEQYGADVVITGSQKALACEPGISVVALSSNALQRAEESSNRCMYLNLKIALDNMNRGQTPFTPAVGILLQIHERLKGIISSGGIEAEVARHAQRASYFRSRIASLPFEFVSEAPSNAVTPLMPLNGSASEIFTVLKNEYGIWICPNGGKYKETVFRVGHLGNLTTQDYDRLLQAIQSLMERGIC